MIHPVEYLIVPARTCLLHGLRLPGIILLYHANLNSELLGCILVLLLV
jgi:hypothetical protein